MALMSMALNDLGVPAISFTGSQAGIFTDDLHSNARIIDVKPIRVESELAQGQVVVLAGFQGVSPLTKEITTLGRGGSDTTAVALAAHFRAEYCEILKDVDGVHSADPNVVKESKHLDRLHYSSLLDMTFWGAKVLHYRSVELAAVMNVPLRITLAHGEGRATLIDGETMYEQARILSVNSHANVRRLEIKKTGPAEALNCLATELANAGLPLPQFLDCECGVSSCSFLVTAPLETLDAIAAKSGAGFSATPEKLSTVTATCQGAYASPLAGEISSRLQSLGIKVQKVIFAALSLTVVVAAIDRERAIQAIHVST
jgi:aspartate kinase